MNKFISFEKYIIPALMNHLKHSLLSVFLFLSFNAFAQIPAPQNPPAGDTTHSVVAVVQPKVDTLPKRNDSIIVLDAKPIQNGNSTVASLNDYIMVTVQNLPLLYQSSGHASDCIVLYIDGVPMHGLNPMSDSKNGNSLIFKLIRDSVTESSWAVFYEAPREKSEANMSISIGYEHDCAVATRKHNFKMVFMDQRRMWVAVVAIILIIFGFFLLARKTQILRDKSTDKTVTNPPYSLARTQILFWTVISAISFIFIWAVTCEIPEITTSTLILLGVSIGTSAGARMIDLSQEDNPKRSQNSNSEGFWKDILSDESGISIYRAQMVLWILIVGFYYLNVAYTYLYMPQLDNMLLALMGISSATYVGLKLPENKTTPPPPAAPANPQ